MSRTAKRALAVALLGALVLAAASPGLMRSWWRWRTSTPVRRGMERATALGCFHCHGHLGTDGIADPGERSPAVPGWSGGAWTTYVSDDMEVREYILNGYAGGPDSEAARRYRDRDPATIPMPAYGDVLRGTDLEDLVAAFKVLSGMLRPSPGSAARRGLDVARRWDCFSCHGPGACGGLSNPGSFTGFIPGWYGPGFRDLVRDRQEFDAWIRDGMLTRLAEHTIASFFLRRQRISMPAYPGLSPGELDDLWAYVVWLEQSGGGHRGTDG